MGQIKNIKLHIVTDIKIQYHEQGELERNPFKYETRRTKLMPCRGRAMGDSPISFLNFKSNPVNTQPCNYKIISINKDQNTNQHSIRIGIEGEQVSCRARRSSNDGSTGSCHCDNDRPISPSERMAYQISPSSPSLQQKVSLKMIPAAQGGTRILKSGSRKASKEDCAFGCSQDELNKEKSEDPDEDVEHCKSVSTARAMFENMASTTDHRLKKVKPKPKLKSWNSSSLLDNTTTESAQATTTASTTTSAKFHAHSKSKSEPVELTLKDYERLSNRRDAGGSGSGDQGNANERCASANDDYIEAVAVSPLESCYPVDILKDATHSTTTNNQDSTDIGIVNSSRKPVSHIALASPFPSLPSSSTTNPSTILHHSSRSEIVCSSTHTELDVQMAALPSYSSEDLRHFGKDVPDTSKGTCPRQSASPTTPISNSASTETRQQTANSANDLREATARYYTHVAKNNPRLRNAIPGKDTNNAMKFSHARKSSSPCEEEFLRGGTRATIATSTSVATRLAPRSKSTTEPPPQPQSPVQPQVELSDLSEMFSRTCDNSIMSRLLRGEAASSSESFLTQLNNSNSSSATLMQIPEENKNASVTTNIECDVDFTRARNKSDCSESTSVVSDTLLRHRDPPYSKGNSSVSSRSCTSINTTIHSDISNERNLHVESQRLHHYRGAKSTGSIVPDMNAEQVQTEARLRRGDNTSTNWMSGSTENVPGTGRSKYQISRTEHGSLHGLSSSSRDMLERDETRASSESLDSDQHVYDVPTIDEDDRFPSLKERVPSTEEDVKWEAGGISNETDIDSGSTPVASAEVCVETDIDADEAAPHEIVHKKDLSTDSAVYVLDEHISHSKALSNVSNDSTHRTEATSPIPYQRYEDNEPPVTSSDGVLYDCDDSNEKEKEKEKPQRTISRRKKDSSLANSRNNSCVSTDSCASTGTNDSGIVLTDSSQRASPMSDINPYDKELNGSRETLDEDINALENASKLSSAPSASGLDRDEQAKNAGYQILGVSRTGSVGSGGSSRRDSITRSGEIDNEKAKLVESMREKINELREQEAEIADEIRVNEDLGKKVQTMVQIKATQVEFGKFELFIGELNKVVALLLSLTQRLHRYELQLQDLDMTNEEDQVKKESLVTRIDKLKSQHEEACYLRDVNDKRGDVVAVFLENYCTEEEFADFQYYVDMKSQLALMQSQIREKVKLGDARLKALELTNSEWTFK